MGRLYESPGRRDEMVTYGVCPKVSDEYPTFGRAPQRKFAQIIFDFAYWGIVMAFQFSSTTRKKRARSVIGATQWFWGGVAAMCSCHVVHVAQSVDDSMR